MRPRELCRARPRRTAVEAQRLDGRQFEIVVEHATDTVFDDIHRPRHRIGGNRQTRGHCFKQDETKGIRAAWEDEDIGRRVVLRQFVSRFGPGEQRIAIAARQHGKMGTIADHHLAAGQVGTQERIQVFLARHTSDIQEHRPRTEQAHRARPEVSQIHPARPAHQALEAALAQVALQRRRCAHDAGARPVETALQGIDPARGQTDNLGGIFGKLGVVAGGEGPPLRQTVPAHGPADRPLGGDVDPIRTHVLDEARHLATAHQRQADRTVARQRHRPEFRRCQERHIDIEVTEFLAQARQRRDDTVDLRIPGIRGDQNPHAMRPPARPASRYRGRPCGSGTAASGQPPSRQSRFPGWPCSFPPSRRN